jgi:DNA-binding GntR family transcriptional regulator
MPSREDIIETHRPIVDAIVAGNAQLAESILRDHNESAGRILVEFFDSHGDSTADLEAQGTSRRLTRTRVK